MATIRNCAAGPRSKARKICEKGMSARRSTTSVPTGFDNHRPPLQFRPRPKGINDSQVSRSSSRNCCFKCRRADFLMARRSAATASFSARRCVWVRVSMCLGKCEIFGRRAPTFRSLGFAYGFITKHNTVQYCGWHHHTGILFAWPGSAIPGTTGWAEGKTLVDMNT
jgi:hypothetical protein